MLKVLEEKDLPVASLRLFASKRSAGKQIPFKGQMITIEEAREDSFQDLDIVLGAAENDIAKQFLPIAAKTERSSLITAVPIV